LNTFSIDEIFIKKKENNKKKKRKKRGGWFWSRISENKKKSKSRFTEIKICHFWKFHKSRWINKRRKSRVTRIKKIPNLSPRFLCRRTAEETRTTPITDHEIKWWKREQKCMRVRRNCNVFNLAMENVLKGLPDKIRDQLSRHHIQIHSNVHIFESLSNCEIVEMIDRFPVYINTMQSCFLMFDTTSKSFQETGWPRSACNFMLPLRSRRNAIHMCTLENNVIHVHCKRSFLVARDFDIIIFF
jgi:hypothetical protein